jgi:hypothetical protein
MSEENNQVLTANPLLLIEKILGMESDVVIIHYAPGSFGEAIQCGHLGAYVVASIACRVRIGSAWP